MTKSVSLHFLQIVQIYVSLPSAAQLWAGVYRELANSIGKIAVFHFDLSPRERN
jgi:hypothetical protein